MTVPLRARLAATAGLACLALVTGCSTGAAATPAGPAPAAAAPAATPADYCTALAAVSTKTRSIGAQSSIAPDQYNEIASALEGLVPIAPADAKKSLTTLVTEYRRIGSGATTVEASGAKIGQATLELVASTQKKCMGG